ncbi:LuxR C-terminal-related transcriptional regulator [Nonomuraea sp. NPDC049400]|uniref:LuxR C-terminal-related transcriptional regulator n=1 Tax=Nonomuraea sp. NPDC049400 TaxID=3364352 RepID=UPI0037BA5738
MTSLASLGLAAEQERLYRHLLRNPRAPLDPALLPTLAELRALGLVDETLNAAAPTVAIDLLVRRRIEQTQRHLSELSLAWDVLTELTEEHRSGRPVQLVEHLPDGSTVTRRIRALLADHPEEFANLKIRARDSTTEYDNTPFIRLLARGLRSRTLFSAHALQDPDQEPHARNQHVLGDLHRVTTEPIRHLAVVNRQVVFVQADPASPTAGALQIRQPGLVAMLADFFDGMWTRARDLDDLPLSPIEQQVLHALTHHDTDEAAARALNISVRKFRAHIADLMARLGAATRFQAALLAKERGWL